MKKYSIIITILILCSCSWTKTIIHDYKIQTTDYSSRIILYSDSTFIEKRKTKSELWKYSGHWNYIVTLDTIIITTIEKSRTQIYTMTQDKKYKINKDRTITLLKE